MNNINSLLSISYDEILNKPGISKKTLNVVLQKLLNHVVVQNKHEIFIGDISRLYLNESSYNYLLVMREKFLDRILINLNNTIDSVLNSEQFPITYKIDLLTENKFIEKSISEMEFNEIEGQEIVYSFVKNNSYI